METAAASDKVRVSMWDVEISNLSTRVSRLGPAARQALSEVLESILVEQTLSTGEAQSAEYLLATLRVTQPGEDLLAIGHVARARRARAIAVEFREDAQALRAQALHQRRRIDRLDDRQIAQPARSAGAPE